MVGGVEEPSLEASVSAHGLHGAGFHDVVQGHIRSHQGSLKTPAGLLSGEREREGQTALLKKAKVIHSTYAIVNVLNFPPDHDLLC